MNIRIDSQTNINISDDVVYELLQIDQLHHTFQKLRYLPHNPLNTSPFTVGLNQGCSIQNRAELDLTLNVIFQSGI